MRVCLTRAEIEALMDSLHAHMAGDTSEGDLEWTDAQHDAAQCALDKLADALCTPKKEQPSCASMP